jgi:uncharacterized protein (DUF1015 family)
MDQFVAAWEQNTHRPTRSTGFNPKIRRGLVIVLLD